MPGYVPSQPYLSAEALRKLRAQSVSPPPERSLAARDIRGELTPIPPAPSLFAKPARPTSAMPSQDELLARLREPMPEPDPIALQEAELERARAGWLDVDEDAVRAGVPEFLARGNARREAEDAEDARRAEGMLFGGPSGYDLLRGREAFAGLQQARRMQDPNYARQQRQADVVASAETSMHPAVQAARQSDVSARLAEKQEFGRIAQQLGLTPEALRLMAIEHKQRMELEGVRASGRNPFGAMMGMGGGAVPQGTPRMSEAAIRAAVIEQGGDEQAVQDTIADARARGMLQ